MAEAAPPPRPRPISPFLFPPFGTYSWQITSAISILHRVSGIALGVGALMLTWWLLALLGEPSDFDAVQDFLGSIFGRTVAHSALKRGGVHGFGGFGANGGEFGPIPIASR